MKKPVVILFLILVSSFSVSGSYISLTTQVSGEEVILRNETQLKIKLINSGDETAYQVQVHFILPLGLQVPALSVGNLVPNAPYTKNVSVKINENLTPGNYPLGILTHYQDANGYPFSSPSFFTLVFKNITISSLFGSMSPLNLVGETPQKLTLKLRNLDSEVHQVKITLLLPRELKATPSEKILNLKPKEETNIAFDVSSLGALSGSSYAVFASLDYEENALHYSSLARGTIQIVDETKVKEEGKKKNFFQNIPSIIPSSYLIILVLLILFFIIYQFKK